MEYIPLYGSEIWTLIAAELFEELLNVMLEENGEDQMAVESN